MRIVVTVRIADMAASRTFPAPGSVINNSTHLSPTCAVPVLDVDESNPYDHVANPGLESEEARSPRAPVPQQ